LIWTLPAFYFSIFNLHLTHNDTQNRDFFNDNVQKEPYEDEELGVQKYALHNEKGTYHWNKCSTALFSSDDKVFDDMFPTHPMFSKCIGKVNNHNMRIPPNFYEGFDKYKNDGNINIINTKRNYQKSTCTIEQKQK